MNLISFKSLALFSLAIIAYYLVPKRHQWKFLLGLSIILYLWANTFYLLFLLVTSTTIFFAAKKLEKVSLLNEEESKELSREEKKRKKEECVRKKKWIVIFCLLLNFGILGYFKYANFFINVATALFPSIPLNPIKNILPLGISFYTFQAIGYLIDVYRGQIEAEKSYLKLLLFLSYLPQLIQGPIGRYKQLAPQLFSHHSFSFSNLKHGALLVLWGLYKKLIVAEGLAMIVNPILEDYTTYKGLYIFIAVFLYSIQIYGDFSGGIDIVTGFSEIMGIQLSENFSRPFFATSVSNFWQRWHMTLGSWMRDYLFYPIAFSPAFTKFNKRLKNARYKKIGKILPSATASMIVFLCVGIWHGSSIKYIAFGLYNGTIITSSLLLQNTYTKWTSKLGIKTESFDWKLFQILRTLLINTIGRFFTRGTSFLNAVGLYKSMVSAYNPWILIDDSFLKFGLSQKKLIVLILAVFGLFTIELIQETGVNIRERIDQSNGVFQILLFVLLSSVILIFGFYGEAVDTANFIYQGF